MDVLSLTVDLVDQGKVEVETFYPLTVEYSDLGLVLLILHVLDHIREPHSQPMVADTHKNIEKTKLSAQLEATAGV